jgi:hypothetical protein
MEKTHCYQRDQDNTKDLVFCKFSFCHYFDLLLVCRVNQTANFLKTSLSSDASGTKRQNIFSVRLSLRARNISLHSMHNPHMFFFYQNVRSSRAFRIYGD